MVRLAVTKSGAIGRAVDGYGKDRTWRDRLHALRALTAVATLMIPSSRDQHSAVTAVETGT